MSLAELERQPESRPCFDPRFITSNFIPKIVNGERIHETNSLPMVLNANFLLEAGIEPEGFGRSYAELIKSEPVMQESLRALKDDEEMYEAAAYAVYLHIQEFDEMTLASETEEVVAHGDIEPAKSELLAKKEFDLSRVYVFLAEKARQIDPVYDIDNFRR